MVRCGGVVLRHYLYTATGINVDPRTSKEIHTMCCYSKFKSLLTHLPKSHKRQLACLGVYFFDCNDFDQVNFERFVLDQGVYKGIGFSLSQRKQLTKGN